MSASMLGLFKVARLRMVEHCRGLAWTADVVRVDSGEVVARASNAGTGGQTDLRPSEGHRATLARLYEAVGARVPGNWEALEYIITATDEGRPLSDGASALEALDALSGGAR